MSIILFDWAPEHVSATDLTRIHAIAPEMRVIATRDRAEIEQMLAEIEIAVVNFPHDLIAKTTRLRWLQLWSAGADWLLRYPDVVAHDVIITNTSGIHAIPMSEHIFAYLLAFAREISQALDYQRQHHWQECEPTFELAGKTLLLIGVGAIGERTAHLAKAFDMRVLGIRRNPAVTIPAVDAMFGPEHLLELLPQADMVVITLPLTNETRHMIGERELRAMQPNAYLVNIGRGPIIDESALIMALQEHRIAGAGLDVFETEPLSENSPLWAMENVIITAHYAGHHPTYDERAFEIFLDNLKRYQAGQPLRNVVNKQLGY